MGSAAQQQQQHHHHPPPPPSTSAEVSNARIARIQEQAKQALTTMQLKVEHAERDMQAALGALERERQLTALSRSEQEASKRECAARLERIMRRTAQERGVEKRRKHAEESARLGRFTFQRIGAGGSDVWEDGEEVMALNAKWADLLGRQRELEALKKELAKRGKKMRGSTAAAAAAAVSSAAAVGGGGGGKKAGGGGGGGAKGGAGAPASALAGDDPEAGEAAEDDSLDLSAFGIFSSGDAADGGGGSGSSADATSSSSVAIFYELNATQSEEGLKISASYLKAEEQELQERRTEYDRRRGVMLLESKRLRAERESKFQNHPTIGAERRYILMELLGKGGFSEVWLAVDLFECREVAVKIHALSEHWSDDKKANYVRHALREFEIQQCLQHPNVVRQHAVIEMDVNSFATVLEYCTNYDLERVLKEFGTLSEREARSIVIQVLAALRYLNGSPSEVEGESAGGGAAGGAAGSSTAGAAGASNSIGGGGGGPSSSLSSSSSSSSSSITTTAAAAASAAMVGGSAPSAASRRPKIIHYDLKPANILFDVNRCVKVTDFGLAKVLGDGTGEDASSSLELTSQGAGTYWYLPPECFEPGRPRISNKVDVWSLGVIFFQMLYGRRPFGEGQTQEQIAQQGVIHGLLSGTRDIVFPPQPKTVSPEAKAFIRKCLTAKQEHRPDVLTLCADPYLRMKLKSSTASGLA